MQLETADETAGRILNCGEHHVDAGLQLKMSRGNIEMEERPSDWPGQLGYVPVCCQPVKCPK